ncbi:hypothetical protein C8R45DRAFT_933318 [Mycena sanguinolenta]|nr:hypothetical protein C8R45DRAFT_933318 [Mycena sanguinolenta]
MNNNADIEQFLQITDNIPLAVQLVATIAASEGCKAALERWKLERTSMLSAGYDKRSNMEISIMLSLSSPRMVSLPQAVDLLSLMSLLSDGISNIDLMQSEPPIPDIGKCQTTLICTALAYVDHTGHFKVLAPIREYIQTIHPPSPILVRPLRNHFKTLVKLWKTMMMGFSLEHDLTPRLLSNTGNLHNLFLHGLNCDHTDLGETIDGIISFNTFTITMNRGFTPLMLYIPQMLRQINDHELHGWFIAEALSVGEMHTVINPEECIKEAIEHFHNTKSHARESSFYTTAAHYFFNEKGDQQTAEKFYHHAISLASQCNSPAGQVSGLNCLARMKNICGNYSESLQLAHEARKIAISSGNVLGEIHSVRLQAMCFRGLGNFNHTIVLVNLGKELIAQVHMRSGQMESMLMDMEAEVHLAKTQYAESRLIQEAILQQTSPVLSPIDHAYAFLNTVFIDLVTDVSTDMVSNRLNAAAFTFVTVNSRHGLWACELLQADLQFREGDKAGACAEYIGLFSILCTEDAELAGLCLVKLADTMCPVHAAIEVRRWAVVFLAFAMRPKVRSMLMMHQALRSLGDALAEEGADDSALSILAISLEGFTWMDVHQSKAECMRTIGDIYLRRGDSDGARQIWIDALPLFKRSEQTRDVAELEDRLARFNCAGAREGQKNVE